MPPCEYPAIAIEPVTSKVMILGGWADRWLSSLACCSVQDIVGPTYAVTAVTGLVPSLAQDDRERTIGPLSGGQALLGFLALTRTLQP